MAVAARDCADGDRLIVLVDNVQQSSEQFEALFRMVDEADPDVFVVLEADARWDAALADTSERFPFRTQFVPQGEDTGAFGMHLLSRHRLAAFETMFYYGNDTPTILADVALPRAQWSRSSPCTRVRRSTGASRRRCATRIC